MGTVRDNSASVLTDLSLTTIMYCTRRYQKDHAGQARPKHLFNKVRVYWNKSDPQVMQRESLLGFGCFLILSARGNGNGYPCGLYRNYRLSSQRLTFTVQWHSCDNCGSGKTDHWRYKHGERLCNRCVRNPFRCTKIKLGAQCFPT